MKGDQERERQRQRERERRVLPRGRSSIPDNKAAATELTQTFEDKELSNCGRQGLRVWEQEGEAQREREGKTKDYVPSSPPRVSAALSQW